MKGLYFGGSSGLKMFMKIHGQEEYRKIPKFDLRPKFRPLLRASVNLPGDLKNSWPVKL
jgi:hypothetical protein